MNKKIVSVVKYEKPLDSVRKVIELSEGFSELTKENKVFIKPNIVYWNRHCIFPKWGVLTTSRVVEDVVNLLEKKDVKDITIGEGIITEDPRDRETAADAFEKLGYNNLKERYGVKVINLFEHKYEKVDLRNSVSAKMSKIALESDFLIDLPVLKTHAQCMVSLGIKNLKGLINMPSRKKFHSADPEHDLDYNVAHLPNSISHGLTIIDGIYSLERGPAMDGKAHRMNILVASKDILAADIVGAKLLGFEPSDIPHLKEAADERKRPLDLSDIEIKGENIDELAEHHEWDYIYAGDDDLPLPYEKAGISGIKYHKYDKSMCTYCSMLNGILLMGIKAAWKGKPFDKIEVLTGKRMEPSPDMNKTILVGQCQCNKNKNHPNINELIMLEGCPPSTEGLQEKLKKAGIRIPSYFFKNLDKGPLLFMQKYSGKPEFEDKFYQVK
ncbi:MAG: DUF362 domain-containing protein [Candidatus Lokiarchaeota archaeon]|nr:DUF362 domain-containing protein [Candidatus Lokiarchaeota archaeon]MBD3340118.1 DUF362 domain-containing protein [Candidatus Lokiarchaeota archaeon]